MKTFLRIAASAALAASAGCMTVQRVDDFDNLKVYGGEGPVLIAKEIKKADPPEHDLVYFT